MFRMLHTYEPFQLPLVPINTNPPAGRAGHISTDGFILPEVAAKGLTSSYADRTEAHNGKKGRRHTEEQIWAYASAVRGFHTLFASAMTHIEIELFAGIQKLFKGPELTRSLHIGPGLPTLWRHIRPRVSVDPLRGPDIVRISWKI